jgi:HEAT repeat protein
LPTNTATPVGNDDMKSGILIPLDRPGRLLKKVRFYLSDLEAFLSDTSAAVTVLLDALPYADTALILKMLPLLGYAGKDRVLWSLYNLMIGSANEEQVRRSAALQLGLAASLSADPSALKAELIKKMKDPDPFVRSSSALALGWEGNWPAVESLVAHLSDPDRDVQAAVVAALSSVGDGRVFDILKDRLEKGTTEQQRSILLNLWRFAERIPHVEDIYVACMEKVAPDLRLDALSGLAIIPLSTSILKVYRSLLADADPRIRHQILKNLSTEDPADYHTLKDILSGLLADEDPRVRQAAIHLFAKG